MVHFWYAWSKCKLRSIKRNLLCNVCIIVQSRRMSCDLKGFSRVLLSGDNGVFRGGINWFVDVLKSIIDDLYALKWDCAIAYELVPCKYCGSSDVTRYGTQSGHSRFRCKEYQRIFKTEYTYRAYEPGVKEQIAERAVNGSGTARVLGIGKNTVMSALKKSPQRLWMLIFISAFLK
jgi:transposase-like protein